MSTQLTLFADLVLDPPASPELEALLAEWDATTDENGITTLIRKPPASATPAWIESPVVRRARAGMLPAKAL